MKVMIDIPEEDYKILKEHILNEDSKKVGFSNLADAYKAIGFPNLGDILARRVINGTPIPDNATNGDVLKAIFPNTVFAEDKYEDDGTTWVDIISDNGMTFEMDFWNASYKAERKDNNE